MKRYACVIFLSLLGVPMVGAEEVKAPSIAELQATAAHGDAAAQYQLASAHLRGEGVPKDRQKAFELMKAAADQGHADAMGGLGYCYSAGVSVPKDQKLALEWFRKGAEKGSAKAQLNLGKLLLKGQGDTAADAEAQRKDGLQWMQKAADQNLPEAASNYGSILYFGDHGIVKNDDLAAKYLKIAAEAGLANAQNILGCLYDFGLGVSSDASLAQQWFRKAALQGNVKAQSNLGRVLGPSSEVKEARIEALAWLFIASDQDEITAKKLLQNELPGLKSGDMESANKLAADLRKQIQPKTSRPN
jgi:TPR repeat protein